MIPNDVNIQSSIASILEERGKIDARGSARGKLLAESEGIRIDRALLKLGLVSEEDLLTVISEIEGLFIVGAQSQCRLDIERTQAMSIDFLISISVAPVIDLKGNKFILSPDPLNTIVHKELEFFLEDEVRMAAGSTRIVRALLASYSDSNTQPEIEASEDQKLEDRETVRKGNIDGPVIRFVDETISEAVAIGASDIHFEAAEGGFRIRFRVDGTLLPQAVDMRLNPKSIFARVKVMANMNVSEKRLPQDGHITANLSGRKIDFRVSSIPTSAGESVVCRILDPKSLRLGWEKLGFQKNLVADFMKLIESPNGLVLVTGPTGSGKTTTLYTALAHLNTDERKIITVEDPIEYDLPGIQQVQVHEEIGLTFSRALRSFLRQDPNIIMIGEIRDQETAEIACRAALVGRLVFSTIHTSSPEAAETRLVDLGVPKYLVRDVLLGVLGQELIVRPGKPRKLTARLIFGDDVGGNP